ncbi:MAG: leucyl aminopeptidase family protein, partial [Rhodospirillales bacterium]
ALVGKGVCFDTGGLDLKTAAGMKLMKKDMGGAASVLALARLVMAQALPVRLHVLIPAVENSIAGDAYRPLDVIETRKGLGVEIFNTDAEGRVILADALFEAARHKPDLIIDCATLTGAARVALGTECPVIFCNDDGLADDLAAAARAEDDPLWRLPLFDDYRYQTESRITDLNNCPDGGFGGAITAALFLEAFVDKGLSWVHVDMMGYNQRARPGRPEGGEAGPIRALFACLAQRYGG